MCSVEVYLLFISECLLRFSPGTFSSTFWKKVLLGEVISDTNEKTSLDITRKICCDFIEETCSVLQKISQMKDDSVALLPQLALVEMLWMEELQILRASAEVLSTLHTTVT